MSARRAWSCHPAECDVITRGDEDYSCQETSCQDKLSRLQLSRGRPRQSVSKFAEAKADDDADTERLPPEPSKSPNSGYAQESYNLRPRQTTTPTLSGYLRSHQQVPTAATPKRSQIKTTCHSWCMGGQRRDRVATSTPSHPHVHGWTTLTQSSYLHAIASENCQCAAQGSASQP